LLSVSSLTRVLPPCNFDKIQYFYHSYHFTDFIFYLSRRNFLLSKKASYQFSELIEILGLNLIQAQGSEKRVSFISL